MKRVTITTVTLDEDQQNSERLHKYVSKQTTTTKISTPVILLIHEILNIIERLLGGYMNMLSNKYRSQHEMI